MVIICVAVIVLAVLVKFYPNQVGFYSGQNEVNVLSVVKLPHFLLSQGNAFTPNFFAPPSR